MSEEDRCIEIIEERDMLADENRKFAEFLSSLGYNLDSIGQIARVGTKFNKPLEEIYEAVAGDNAINNYTHEEIIDRINEMYDCYQYVVDNVYSKGKYIERLD